MNIAPGTFSSFDICILEDCNLRCRYCSTGYGRWGHSPRQMKRATMDIAIDFMIRSSTPSFKVGFSGGETLMAFDNLKYFIDQLFRAKKQQGKKVFVELATNGVLLTESICQYLADHRIGLVISIDGDARTTDRNRVSRNGAGVYHRIMEGFKLYSEGPRQSSAPPLPARADCTIDSKACLFDSVQHLFNCGFKEVLARPVSTSEYTGFSDASANARFLASLGQLVQNVLKPLELDDIISGNYRHMLINIRELILGLIDPVQHGISCGALNQQICITATGDLAPCFPLYQISETRHRLGSVFTGLDASKHLTLQNSFEASNAGCRTCWAKPLCSQCYVYTREMARCEDAFGRHTYCQLVKGTLTILKKELARRYPDWTVFHESP